MKDAEFTAGSLRCALSAVGLDELAARLHVPPQRIHIWIQGDDAMPQRTFMLLLDLLLDVSPSAPLPGLS